MAKMVKVWIYLCCVGCVLVPTISQNFKGAELSTATVPVYHVPMLNDQMRNDAYYRALAKVITPDSVVVDVGAGSGLLSCMAAKLGARKVFAVERRGDLCNVVLHEIIAANNFTGE